MTHNDSIQYFAGTAGGTVGGTIAYTHYLPESTTIVSALIVAIICATASFFTTFAWKKLAHWYKNRK